MSLLKRRQSVSFPLEYNKAVGYHEELFRTHQSYRYLYNLHNQYLAQTKIADNIHERIETFEVK